MAHHESATIEMGEKRRNITFNLNDPKDRARYELSKKINLSKFVKAGLDYELKRLAALEAQKSKQAVENNTTSHHTS